MNKKIEFLIDNIFEIILSIPNTIMFNFRVLPFKQAIKLPFYVSYHVHWKGLNKNNFIINVKDIKTLSNRIGFGYSDGGYRESKKSLIAIKGKGKIIVNEDIGLGQGIVLEAYNGEIELGRHFRCNYSCSIYSNDSFIKIGDNVSLGWNVVVKNNDGHNVIENKVIKAKSAPVIIGNHCWICSHSDVLKGVHIGNNCIIAYKSIVTKSFKEDNLMLAGCPAKIVKYNVDWVK